MCLQLTIQPHMHGDTIFYSNDTRFLCCLNYSGLRNKESSLTADACQNLEGKDGKNARHVAQWLAG